MRNFEVVLVCLTIGCLVQLIQPQEFDPENDDFDSRDKLDLKTNQFSSRVRRQESETDECGINSAHTKFSVWPWLAAVILQKSDQSEAIDCAGTIINKRFVMTSAICVTDRRGMANKPDTVSVVLGLANRSGADHSQQFDIRAIHVHPMYNSAIYDNAIALLELDKPIEYNNWMSPICLPTTSDNFYKHESRGLGIGWGKIEGKPTSTLKRNTLKEVEVVIQSPAACRKSLGDRFARYYTERLTCGIEESPYLCMGDSGAPIMQSEMNEDGQSVWTQVGIVTFGIGCGPVNPVGYYTRVDKYIPWIQSTAF